MVSEWWKSTSFLVFSCFPKQSAAYSGSLILDTVERVSYLLVKCSLI